MDFYYDKTTDSLYITLAPGSSTESEEVSEDLIVDYNASGHVVGLDIQHASKRFDLSNIHIEGFTPAVDVRPKS